MDKIKQNLHLALYSVFPEVFSDYVTIFQDGFWVYCLAAAFILIS